MSWRVPALASVPDGRSIQKSLRRVHNRPPGGAEAPRAQAGGVPLLAAIPEFQKQGLDLGICRKPSPTGS